jgi:Asp-tRNA(Asn)/Glu-tRNA(Gln) amidotransferase A subunit family amidase
VEQGADGLRIAVAGGYFASQGQTQVFEPVARAAKALKVNRTVVIPDAGRARAAAYIITACEGGNLHLADLRTRPQDFDPLTVERFFAGALLPASWYRHAQRFRSVFREQMREVFKDVDVILAPATPCPAVTIGQATIVLNGVEVAARPNIGVFTQPLSFIGLPIVCAPIFEPGTLPVGIQIIAAPYREAAALRVAHELEARGVAAAPIAALS